jgi:hypothetical protein
VDGAVGKVGTAAIGELAKDALEPDSGDLAGSVADGGLAHDADIAAVADGEVALQLIGHDDPRYESKSKTKRQA